MSPSPILKYNNGRFKNMRTGVTISASKKHPVFAYRRNTTAKKATKGAWGYYPRGRKIDRRPAYRVSIVGGHGLSSAARDASRVSESRVAVPSGTYRHISDWTWSESSPRPKKRKVPKGKKKMILPYTKKVGAGKTFTKKEYDDYISNAVKMRKRAARKRAQARRSQKPETVITKAKESKKLDTKAKKLDQKVVDAKDATKTQKTKARKGKKAAGSAEQVADKIIAKAEKAKARKKTKGKKSKAKKKKSSSASKVMP